MRRQIRVVALFLVMGVMVNVAVAWGLVLWMGDSRTTLDDASALEVLQGHFPEAAPIGPYVVQIGSGPGIQRSVSAAIISLPTSEERMVAVFEIRAGIPMHAASAQAMVVDDRVSYSGGLRLSDGLAGRLKARAGSVVPLRPVNPGFFINSVFYATLLWMLYVCASVWRRALRRKRRLCEKCAYPIGVSPVCTECGAAVVRRNAK